MSAPGSAPCRPPPRCVVSLRPRCHTQDRLDHQLFTPPSRPYRPRPVHCPFVCPIPIPFGVTKPLSPRSCDSAAIGAATSMNRTQVNPRGQNLRLGGPYGSSGKSCVTDWNWAWVRPNPASAEAHGRVFERCLGLRTFASTQQGFRKKSSWLLKNFNILR